MLDPEVIEVVKMVEAEMMEVYVEGMAGAQ